MDELQSDKQTINDVFRRHKLRVKGAERMIARVSETPYTSFQSSAWNIIALDRNPAVPMLELLKPKWALEIDAALSSIRMVETHCRIEAFPDLCVMVPRHNPTVPNVVSMLHKHAAEKRAGSGLNVLVGEVVRDTVQPLFANMARAEMPHMLIAGSTGSGKTYQMMNIVLSLSALNNPDDLEIVVVDPKALDMDILNGLPGLKHAVVQDLADCMDAVDATVAEIERRHKLRMKNPRKRHVLVVDEVADLIAVGGKRVVSAIERIVQVGRGYGVHFIGGAQKPTNDVFDSQVIKANIPMRFVGIMASKSDATTAAGRPDSGAENLSTPGAFVMIAPGGRMEMIQAYHLDENQVRKLGGGSIARQYQPTNDTATSVAQSISLADTSTDTAVDTTRRLAFDVYGQPTPDEARIIRAMLKSGMSKNRIIAEILPNANRNKCFDFINAANSGRK